MLLIVVGVTALVLLFFAKESCHGFVVVSRGVRWRRYKEWSGGEMSSAMDGGRGKE